MPTENWINRGKALAVTVVSLMVFGYGCHSKMVPLTCLWDGVISQFRAYTAAEMLELTRGLDDYDWTSDRVGIAGTAGHLTYLVGIPRVI